MGRKRKSSIWSRCCKEMNTSKQRVESAVSQAVLDFNVGTTAYVQNFQNNAVIYKRIEKIRGDAGNQI